MFNNPPIPHLYSLHSWLGVLTITLFLSEVSAILILSYKRVFNGHYLMIIHDFYICIIFQFAVGFVSFLYPGVAVQYKKVIMPYHIYFGVFTFVLAIATSVLGFGEKLIFSLYVIF